MDTGKGSQPIEHNDSWLHKSDPRFTNYYAEASLTPETSQRFSSLMSKILRIVRDSLGDGSLEVVDVGCGPGAQAAIWAEHGHHVHGIDVNQPLIELAQQRSEQAGVDIDYRVGSATELPWSNESMDLCLLPELLEHVEDWKSCLEEAVRVLKPGGILYLSTSNRLCPVQQEFDLPLYSWYPSWLKHRFEKLAVTTKPELVNFAPYPAINWFTYYGLRAYLHQQDMVSIDRFQFKARTSSKRIHQLLSFFAAVRFLGQLLTPYTIVVATKSGIE